MRNSSSRYPLLLMFLALLLVFSLSFQAKAADDDDDLLLKIIPALASAAKKTPPLGFNRESLSSLAMKTGVSLDGIQRIKLGHYTDIFTLPNLKTECSDIQEIKVFGQTIDLDGNGQPDTYCNGYTNYKQVMNCEWYITAPMLGDSATFDVKKAVDQAIDDAVKNLTGYVNERIRAAIDRTLIRSGASAAVAGFATGCVAAVSTFFATFLERIKPELELALNEIENYIAGMSFIKSVSFPGADRFSKPTQSCNWSEWTPL